MDGNGLHYYGHWHSEEEMMMKEIGILAYVVAIGCMAYYITINLMLAIDDMFKILSN